MVVGVVPEGLAAMPPGLALRAALDRIDPARVSNDRMLEVLRAQYRQLCHEQARMAAVLAELGRCERVFEPGAVARMPGPDEYSADEARAALRWTRRAADREHELAESAVHGQPRVFGAWLAGELDRPRVVVFDRYLVGLSAAQVEEVCRIAVPRAPRLTTGQLAALLRRLVIAVDPHAAERWYRRGVRERNVTAVLEHDGTVTMCASGLPPDAAEAACLRVQQLADAAKRAGHPGLIGQIRCDAFLGLLDGRFHHMTRDQIIAALIADYTRDEWDPAGPPPDAPGPDAVDLDAVAHPDGGHGGHGGEGGHGGRAARGAAARTSGPAERAHGRPQPAAGGGPVGIEIRVALSTLLGLDDHPAEIPGLGPLVAPAARARVAAQGRSEWRFAVVDEHGRLVTGGLTRRRPDSIGRRGPRGGIVEIQVSETLLADLAAAGAEAGEWAGVIADIARRHADRTARAAARDAHPRARLPHRELRRHTEIRDRTCTFPGCRHPARSSEQDHTRAHARGGDTVGGNLGALCGHDHDVKHGGGWRVDQPEPGVFVWRSPLGGTYATRGEAFLPPMPEPRPARLDELFDLPRPVLEGPILLPRHHRTPKQPPPGDPDEPPPF